MDPPTAFVQPNALPRTHKPCRPCVCMTDDSKPSEKPSTPPAKPRKARKPLKTVRSSATWADTFLPGFGRKGPGSRPDWDLRPKSLRNELKEQDKICDNCKGTGKMICSFCEGTLFTSADGADMKCPACSGVQSVTCSACFGTLRQIELVCQPLVFKCYHALTLLTFFFFCNRSVLGGRRVWLISLQGNLSKKQKTYRPLLLSLLSLLRREYAWNKTSSHTTHFIHHSILTLDPQRETHFHFFPHSY